MPAGPKASPYPLGTPVTDPRLLQNRRTEISVALDAVAPTDPADTAHAMVLGEQRSGRTSVLLEVARRAAADRNRLVVSLPAIEECAWSRAGLTRRLLTAIVESLARGMGTPSAPWYAAWRDRVYLRDRSPSTERDLLSSALALAVDPNATIDHAVLQRDLGTLLELAHVADRNGILICLDDATPLTEDVALIEDLVETLDAVGSYGLLLAGLPASAIHFKEAASPCLARLSALWLQPFSGPQRVLRSLSAPLSDAERDWVHADDPVFLRDLLRLTGGNPYELMLVAHHLWLTCQRGEQDKYVLTPRVLDRVIPDLSLLASGGDALLDGAAAIDRLAEEQVKKAVGLVAQSKLTVRQIAIARILRVHDRDTDHVDRAILTADISQESARVLGELEELEEAGVVQLHADGDHFSVVGGRPTSVLLKYQARARIGADASRQPFELDFLFAVGRPVIRDLAVRARNSIDGSASLGSSAIMSRDGAGRLSPRPAIRNLGTAGGIARLAQAEIDLIPWGGAQYDRIVDLLSEDDPSVALAYTALTHGREQLEYTEVWEVPSNCTHEHMAGAWSAVTEEWEPVAAAADMNWNGSEFAVLGGEAARQVLAILLRPASASAVHKLFDTWYSDRDDAALRRAQKVGEETVATMRASGLSDWDLAGDLSRMLSRVGFLKSFDDSLLEEARATLEEASRTGPADGWVTSWNLANVTAREGDVAAALTKLDDVEKAVQRWRSYAFVIMFVPGRAAEDSLLKITYVGIADLLALQRAIVADEPDQVSAALERCRTSDDPGATQAAEWVAEAFASNR